MCAVCVIDEFDFGFVAVFFFLDPFWEGAAARIRPKVSCPPDMHCQ